jgi:hypothetical protein
MKTLAILAVVALVTSGCLSSKSLSPIIKELAKDPAVVNITAVSPGFTFSMSRVGVTTNSVTVAPNGALTVNALNK